MNNYEKTLLRAEQVFLKYPQDEMIKALDLNFDECYIYINFFQQPYRINRGTGRIEAIESNENIRHCTFSEGMSIFDYICEPIPFRTLSGDFVDTHYFAKVGFSANNLYQQYADTFAKHLIEFRQACFNIGGNSIQEADASYIFYPFSSFPLKIMLWEGEDGIPASLRFLWDRNTGDFIRYETMFYIISHLMEKIAAEIPCEIEPFAAVKAETLK